MENNTTSNKHGSHMNSKKRTGLIVVSSIVAVAVIALCVWFFWLKDYLAAGNADPVYVSSVASITGAGSDSDPRYSGLVEPQQITKINKDDTRTVSEVLVQEGDEVSVGTPLFRYDTEEMQLSIRQAELELEGISNQITTFQDQKKTLEAEKAKAGSDEQYSYVVSIQSVELSIKEQEYQRSVKQSELEKLKKSLDNNEVLSEVEGVIQQINLTPKTDNNGQPMPYMSILSSGEFRIKGTITEQNIGSIYEGQPVTIRSRVDADTVWSGTIDSISYEPAENNNNNMMYYGGMDQGQQSSKYNFYVGLANLEGLILGQHVYIEPQAAQSTTQREGLWLSASYILVEGVKDGEEPTGDTVGYVWVRNEAEKLEKRQVLLGAYDAGESLYEIVSGLELSDYIAYPMEGLVEGGPTTTDASAQVDPDMDMSMGETDPGANMELLDPDDFAGDMMPDMDGDTGGEAGSDDAGEDIAPENGDGVLAMPQAGEEIGGVEE